MSNNHYLLVQASIICLLLFFRWYDSDESRLVSVTFPGSSHRARLRYGRQQCHHRNNAVFLHTSPNALETLPKLAIRAPNGWQAECQLGLANLFLEISCDMRLRELIGEPAVQQAPGRVSRPMIPKWKSAE